MFLLVACSDYAVHLKNEEVDGEATDDCADAPPESYTVALDDACAFEPPKGAFSPVVEWRWDHATFGYLNGHASRRRRCCAGPSSLTRFEPSWYQAAPEEYSPTVWWTWSE
jgi:hypothetical protein